MWPDETGDAPAAHIMDAVNRPDTGQIQERSRLSHSPCPRIPAISPRLLLAARICRTLAPLELHVSLLR
ncbi:hypothetical protein ATPR_2960 [Acetobacter tropicalis NBRC 101654]|uniref:Uncharacterized protein n=1 Tax=Acetobacter tropicalis NBRC 101654 TaxID=749388 RepID=F7VHW1_9PROT|nr:hypothetical protein ATPR_2960 [Acetobacter tropicalis NBRC 101654]